MSDQEDRRVYLEEEDDFYYLIIRDLTTGEMTKERVFPLPMVETTTGQKIWLFFNQCGEDSMIRMPIFRNNVHIGLTRENSQRILPELLRDMFQRNDSSIPQDWIIPEVAQPFVETADDSGRDWRAQFSTTGPEFELPTPSTYTALPGPCEHSSPTLADVAEAHLSTTRNPRKRMRESIGTTFQSSSEEPTPGTSRQSGLMPPPKRPLTDLSQSPEKEDSSCSSPDDDDNESLLSEDSDIDISDFNDQIKDMLEMQNRLDLDGKRAARQHADHVSADGAPPPPVIGRQGVQEVPPEVTQIFQKDEMNDSDVRDIIRILDVYGPNPTPAQVWGTRRRCSNEEWRQFALDRESVEVLHKVHFFADMAKLQLHKYSFACGCNQMKVGGDDAWLGGGETVANQEVKLTRSSAESRVGQFTYIRAIVECGKDANLTLQHALSRCRPPASKENIIQTSIPELTEIGALQEKFHREQDEFDFLQRAILSKYEGKNWFPEAIKSEIAAARYQPNAEIKIMRFLFRMPAFDKGDTLRPSVDLNIYCRYVLQTFVFNQEGKKPTNPFNDRSVEIKGKNFDSFLKGLPEDEREKLQDRMALLLACKLDLCRLFFVPREELNTRSGGASKLQIRVTPNPEENAGLPPRDCKGEDETSRVRNMSQDTLNAIRETMHDFVYREQTCSLEDMDPHFAFFLKVLYQRNLVELKLEKFESPNQNMLFRLTRTHLTNIDTEGEMIVRGLVKSRLYGLKEFQKCLILSILDERAACGSDIICSESMWDLQTFLLSSTMVEEKKFRIEERAEAYENQMKNHKLFGHKVTINPNAPMTAAFVFVTSVGPTFHFTAVDFEFNAVQISYKDEQQTTRTLTSVPFNTDDEIRASRDKVLKGLEGLFKLYEKRIYIVACGRHTTAGRDLMALLGFVQSQRDVKLRVDVIPFRILAPLMNCQFIAEIDREHEKIFTLMKLAWHDRTALLAAYFINDTEGNPVIRRYKFSDVEDLIGVERFHSRACHLVKAAITFSRVRVSELVTSKWEGCKLALLMGRDEFGANSLLIMTQLISMLDANTKERILSKEKEHLLKSFGLLDWEIQNNFQFVIKDVPEFNWANDPVRSGFLDLEGFHSLLNLVPDNGNNTLPEKIRAANTFVLHHLPIQNETEVAPDNPLKSLDKFIMTRLAGPDKIVREHRYPTQRSQVHYGGLYCRNVFCSNYLDTIVQKFAMDHLDTAQMDIEAFERALSLTVPAMQTYGVDESLHELQEMLYKDMARKALMVFACNRHETKADYKNYRIKPFMGKARNTVFMAPPPRLYADLDDFVTRKMFLWPLRRAMAAGRKSMRITFGLTRCKQITQVDYCDLTKFSWTPKNVDQTNYQKYINSFMEKKFKNYNVESFDLETRRMHVLVSTTASHGNYTTHIEKSNETCGINMTL